MSGPVVYGLIPARAGSKRLPHKNTLPLAGHPLLAWTVQAALESGVYERVVVSTDSPGIAQVAEVYGAEVVMRPEDMATHTSPDLMWVNHAFNQLEGGPGGVDAFSILRPTSPFRSVDTIRSAWELFSSLSPTEWDSLRAVEVVSQHPGKMWVESGHGGIKPLLPWTLGGGQTWNQPTNTLATVYVQNASLEFAWRHVLPSSISGDRIMPWWMQGWDGFDINTWQDWVVAEKLVEEGLVPLEMKARV